MSEQWAVSRRLMLTPRCPTSIAHERLGPSLTVFGRLAMTDTIARIKDALSDRYAIERELGAGGIATVYLSHDLKPDRKVAA